MIEHTIINVTHKNCSDGIMSSAVVLKYCLANNIKFVEYPMMYGDAIDVLELLIQSQVSHKVGLVFTDFSLPVEQLISLSALVTNTLILDHHLGAKEKLADERLQNPSLNITTKFDMNKAGCTITWDHFFPNEWVPKLIDLVGSRDLWNFSNEETKPLTAVIRDDGMDTATWLKYLNNPALVDKMIKEGAAVTKHQEKFYKSEATKTVDRLVASDTTKDNVIINLTEGISEILNYILLDPRYKASVATSYRIKNGKVLFSVRSIDNKSAKEVAENFGGSGHPNSSGFNMTIQEAISYKFL